MPPSLKALTDCDILAVRCGIVSLRCRQSFAVKLDWMPFVIFVQLFEYTPHTKGRCIAYYSG
jgi:hypothetical protein